MRAPIEWLRELTEVETGAKGVDVAATLVRVGLEEEEIHGGGVTGPLVVGRVLERTPEEQKNGKTINWCQVDVGAANGSGEPQGIVCGAHNFDVGDLVAVILPGGVLPGNVETSARKTYGHVSAGMICSSLELGLGEDHDGIIVLTEQLPADVVAGLAPGDDLIEVLGLDAETVEVNVTPDRGYCFSMRGIAREYALSRGVAFHDPADLPVAEATGPGYEVRLADEAPIDGVRPTHWLHYDGDMSHGARVDWVLDRMEEGVRFATLYFDVVDVAGHEYGPDAPETREAVARVDSAIGVLREQLETRGLSPVNVVVVSDHVVQRRHGVGFGEHGLELSAGLSGGADDLGPRRADDLELMTEVAALTMPLGE